MPLPRWDGPGSNNKPLKNTNMKYSKLIPTLAAVAVFAAVPPASAVEGTKTSGMNSLVDASKLDGREVWDFHGNKLGHLQQVLVDPQSGRVRYGILEVDKSWSWADPTVAVPWGSFSVKNGDDQKPVLSIDATKEKLQNAPKFKDGDADRLYDKTAGEPIYTYWGIYWFEETDPAKNQQKDTSADTTPNQDPGNRESESTATDRQSTSPADTPADQNPAARENTTTDPQGKSPTNTTTTNQKPDNR